MQKAHKAVHQVEEKAEMFHGIPVWEIMVFVAAVGLILLVFLLWWLFGFKYVVAPSSETVINLPNAALSALIA